VTRHDPRIPRSTVSAVYSRAQSCCEDCGTIRGLELHHLRYETMLMGDIVSIHGRETPDDVDLLCRNCHHQRHIGPLSGAFHRDPVEVENEQFDLERMMSAD